MKTQTVFITALLIFIFSCKQQKENSTVLSYSPKVVEAHGYVVPKDSMAEPKLLPVGEPWVVPAGKPKVTPVATNVHPVGNSEIILADTTVHTPGQGSFSLPKTFPAIGKTILAGSPEVIIAKDAVAKDQNLYNFSSFGTIQGLINADIQSIFEDKKGNLWVGTYGGGVCKYDGVSFTHFTEKQGLGSNIVVSILEDKSENLWFGTLGGGLVKYDGKSFTRFTDKEGLGSNFVNCILEDQIGNLWIGATGGGVTKYDPADRHPIVSDTQINHSSSQGSFTRFTEKEGLSQDNVNTIFEDEKGNLWFGTHGGGMCKYDGKSFIHFTEKENLRFGIVKAIVDDKKGNLWFGGWGWGVVKYDGKHFTHFTTREGLSHNNIKAILEDKNGTIWFGTEGGGINLYDAGDGSTQHPSTFTHFTEKDGLSSNIVSSILKDKNGILWIATSNSLNKYMGKSITHFTEKYGITGRIKCIMESKNGNLWFGGFDGLSMYDGKFITHFTEKEGLSQNNVNTILEDKNGNLWIGSYAGATKYDGKSFTHFMGSTGLGWANVHSIKEDKTGNLWFGMYGRGISRYDGKSFTHFTSDAGLNSNWVWTILEDRNDNFWIGTSVKGVCKYNPFEKDVGFTYFTEKDENSGKNVYAILEDKKGNLWFGTGGSGVICYNPSSSEFTHFTKEQGLTSDFVSGILEDKNNNLWFGTSNGISKLDKNYLQKIADKKTNPINQSSNHKTPILFKNFDYTDGFHGISASQNAICEDKNGIIWIGTNNRLTALNPGEEIPDSMPPNIQLTGLALFNEYISWQDLEKKRDANIVLGNGDRIHDFRFEEVNKWYGIPQQPSLAYDNNHLTFRYVGITIHSPKKVRYQYILEGLDKNWSALTDRTEIPYNNLSHGKYTFKVKAMNSEGYWSKEFNYPFRIRPPWWLSTWAYSFYGLCLIITVIIIHRIQRRRIIIKERERSKEKELAQAKEIEKAYHKLEQSHENLKATQAQLIQSEKMASLGELTAGIAHEIQNPLNFVNNFSEVNKELLVEMNEEIEKANFNEVKAIAKDVIDNEEKINHHGKRADAIVKGMLQHSRSSNGVTEPTDINKLADEYLRLSYHGLRAKDKSFNATMKTEYDESIGNINIVPQDIGRVILNLITNAFYVVNEKKSQGPEGYEPTVSVSTKKTGDRILISVKDNGNGIPQKVLDKIFQPFFTTKPTGQGTGLGLSLSYDIVKAHGGEIKVETKEGFGSEFIISLPFK
jgi:ligand-binding sensor domain-containing protein/signal transduction histidine kinase